MIVERSRTSELHFEDKVSILIIKLTVMSELSIMLAYLVGVIKLM